MVLMTNEQEKYWLVLSVAFENSHGERETERSVSEYAPFIP